MVNGGRGSVVGEEWHGVAICWRSIKEAEEHNCRCNERQPMMLEGDRSASTHFHYSLLSFFVG
jgi:hypothetical protein